MAPQRPLPCQPITAPFWRLPLLRGTPTDARESSDPRVRRRRSWVEDAAVRPRRMDGLDLNLMPLVAAENAARRLFEQCFAGARQLIIFEAVG